MFVRSVLEETLQKCARDWVVCVHSGSRIVNASIDGHALQKRARGCFQNCILVDYSQDARPGSILHQSCELLSELYFS